MSDRKELEAIKEEVSRDLPSFVFLPVEEGKSTDALFGVVIQSGDFERCTVVVRSIEIVENGNRLEIDYNAIDENDNPISDERLGPIVGGVVNYMLCVKALEEIDDEDIGAV